LRRDAGPAISANLSVKEVAELYQEVRGELRGTFERATDDKHLALALFVDELRASGGILAGLPTPRARPWRERPA
jgi:hypothetical protein